MNPGRVGSGGAEKDHWGRQHHHHHQCLIGKNGSGAAGGLMWRPASSPPPVGRKSAPSSIAPSEAPPKLERGGEHRRAPSQRLFSLSSSPPSPSVFPPSTPRGDAVRSGGLRWRSLRRKADERSASRPPLAFSRQSEHLIRTATD